MATNSGEDLSDVMPEALKLSNLDDISERVAFKHVPLTIIFFHSHHFYSLENGCKIWRINLLHEPLSEGLIHPCSSGESWGSRA
jgi:hypothetical protein